MFFIFFVILRYSSEWNHWIEQLFINLYFMFIKYLYYSINIVIAFHKIKWVSSTCIYIPVFWIYSIENKESMFVRDLEKAIFKPENQLWAGSQTTGSSGSHNQPRTSGKGGNPFLSGQRNICLASSISEVCFQNAAGVCKSIWNNIKNTHFFNPNK